jgi:type III pantothenate kinase
MLVVVDVGNTHTVIGLFKGETLLEHWRLRTNKERTSDEWGLTFKNLFSLKSRSIEAVSAMAVSSVVPPATRALVSACESYFGLTPLVIGPGVKTGLPIRYETPREVGADRVVNAVAGFTKIGKACIIVDFGTATTFDCISSNGEYLGGAITPGITTSLDALVERTSKLPRVEIAEPRAAIGRNTVESMQSGILFGYVSLVDGLVERLKKEMGGEVTVIATGGLAEAIASKSSAIDLVDPHMTLDGLRIIYEKNQG